MFQKNISWSPGCSPTTSPAPRRRPTAWSGVGAALLTRLEEKVEEEEERLSPCGPQVSHPGSTGASWLSHRPAGDSLQASWESVRSLSSGWSRKLWKNSKSSIFFFPFRLTALLIEWYECNYLEYQSGDNNPPLISNKYVQSVSCQLSCNHLTKMMRKLKSIRAKLRIFRDFKQSIVLSTIHMSPENICKTAATFLNTIVLPCTDMYVCQLLRNLVIIFTLWTKIQITTIEETLRFPYEITGLIYQTDF